MNAEHGSATAIPTWELPNYEEKDSIYHRLGIYTFQTGASHIYGVEYKDSGSIMNIFDMRDTTESGSVYLHTVPCSVCVARFKVTQVRLYSC